MGKALSITLKDLRSEMRSREGATTMVFLSLMILVVFRMVLDPRGGTPDADVVAAVLWATFYFAGMVAVASTFARERDRGTLEGLIMAPGGAFAIYVGKLLSSAVISLAVNSLSILFLGILFNYNFGPAVGLVWLVMAGGTFGFLSIGTIISAMVRGARAREALVTILLIPLTLFTVVMPSVEATTKILEGKMDLVAPSLFVLVPAMIVYVALASLMFDYVMED